MPQVQAHGVSTLSPMEAYSFKPQVRRPDAIDHHALSRALDHPKALSIMCQVQSCRMPSGHRPACPSTLRQFAWGRYGLAHLVTGFWWHCANFMARHRCLRFWRIDLQTQDRGSGEHRHLIQRSWDYLRGKRAGAIPEIRP